VFSSISTVHLITSQSFQSDLIRHTARTALHERSLSSLTQVDEECVCDSEPELKSLSTASRLRQVKHIMRLYAFIACANLTPELLKYILESEIRY